MKSIFSLLLCTLLLAAPSLLAQDDETGKFDAIANLPAPVREGLVRYIEGNKTQAINYWNDYFIPTSKGEALTQRLRDDLTTITKEYRKPERVEMIGIRKITPHYKQYFVMLSFQRGLIVFRFDVLDTAEGPKIYELRYSANPDKILPPLREIVEH